MWLPDEKPWFELYFNLFVAELRFRSIPILQALQVLVDFNLPTERGAIKTIQVSTPDADEGGSLFHPVQRCTGNDFGASIALKFDQVNLETAIDPKLPKLLEYASILEPVAQEEKKILGEMSVKVSHALLELPGQDFNAHQLASKKRQSSKSKNLGELRVTISSITWVVELELALPIGHTSPTGKQARSFKLRIRRCVLIKTTRRLKSIDVIERFIASGGRSVSIAALMNEFWNLSSDGVFRPNSATIMMSYGMHRAGYKDPPKGVVLLTPMVRSLRLFALW
ncbi:hypothetical protein HBI38_000150 [Parastagonospora nodorum]|nr:hypothetical protein HBI80_129930 [Parastagonospora nodorum]KAH4915860.1 hypothetical protein HBH73_237530 [Parastagonospora nodorum]KAH4952337.1 hypothetical protein HBH74_014170 [Parastagonospora nodorum]KAH5173938.1 hypothetical protein HBH76_235390 [Parastagonospora nodorum]KAH5329536.1 hypothetical protein HBI11_021930 [Parastagonospora nodorum]